MEYSAIVLTVSSISLQEDPLHKKYRSENDILAFTWWHFMYHTNEPEYVAWLPMTKVLQIPYNIPCKQRSLVHLDWHMHIYCRLQCEDLTLWLISHQS